MNTSSTELSCFVISPIGDKNAAAGSESRQTWEQSIQIWEEIIEPACKGAGIVSLRADQIGDAGDINDQIFKKLRDSHVVIADLTGANPNVMYELGLRHTTGKLTIQIGEAGRLPFDVSTIRTVIFKRTPGGLIEARRRLAEALAAGIDGRFTPVAATRVWLETPSVDDILENVDLGSATNTSAEEESGYLEVLADMNVARSDMMASLNAIGNVIVEIGKHVGSATQEIANAGGADATVEAKIAISNNLASSIEEPATRLESLTNSFAESVKRSDPGTRLVIESIKKGVDKVDKITISQRQSLFDFFSSLRKSLISTEEYKRTLEVPAPTKAQGKQNRRIALALDAQIAIAPVIEQWLSLLG